MTKFLTVDQPTSQPERRRGKYAARKFHADPDGLSIVEFFATVGACVLVLAMVSMVLGCESTDASGKPTDRFQAVAS